MPKSIAQCVKLYEKDVSSGSLTALLDLAEFAGIEHGTRLPGGFFEARLTLPATEGEFWDWRQNRLLSRLVVEEAGGKLTWEGRIEDVALVDLWQVQLTAYGYWSNLTDSVLNRSYSSGADTGKSIIADLLSGMHADTRQVSPSADHLETGPRIAQTYQDDWTVWKILTDHSRGVASFGSGGGVKMDIGVWEGRRLHYKRRSPQRIDWRSFLRPENGGGVARLPSRISWGDVANAVAVTYETSGTVARTSEAIDGASIARHVREGAAHTQHRRVHG